MSGAGESIERFSCFGGCCEVIVAGPGARRTAAQAAGAARRLLETWHVRFSRFQPDSELSRVNGDPRRTLAVSPLMARLAAAVAWAGGLSGGLVDATLADEIRAAGYEHDLGETLALERALRLAPRRAPGGPAREARWSTVEADVAAATITRPPGVKLDGGGLAKGLFADALAAVLANHESFALNCAGDLALGGLSGAPRPVKVQSPFDESILHTFQRARGGVATSGIGRRAWLDGDGRPAHHLLDPATGSPAFTGVVQATALAPTALEAEIRAKAAILSGPAAAVRWLSDGGVVVFDDGSHQALAPPLSEADEDHLRAVGLAREDSERRRGRRVRTAQGATT